MGKNTVQANVWLEKCYPDSAPSKTTIKRWFADIKRGRRDTDDAERPGRPNEEVISENIEKTLKIIMENRTIKLQEIVVTLNLSKGRNYPEKTSFEEEKDALSQKQCTVSQVNKNNPKIGRIGYRIDTAPTVFSRSGPQRLLALRRTQKDDPWEEIWLR
nr:protein GVQW3-like [Lepeophtheirus salmonis]